MRPRSGLRLASALSEFVTPAIARVVQTEWRIRMEARLAAAALAARLYYAEHGRWPESIEALVPDYLPVVPLDPWADGAAINIAQVPRGLPDGSPRPVVYSGGEGRTTRPTARRHRPSRSLVSDQTSWISGAT